MSISAQNQNPTTTCITMLRKEVLRAITCATRATLPSDPRAAGQLRIDGDAYGGVRFNGITRDSYSTLRAVVSGLCTGSIQDRHGDLHSSLIVSPKAVAQFLRAAKGEESCDFTANGSTVTVSAGARSVTLETTDLDEWPMPLSGGFDDGETAYQVDLPTAEFADMLRASLAAAAKEAGRYAMHGVLLEPGDKGLRIVGTDGRRLHLCDSADFEPMSAEPYQPGYCAPVILPRDAMGAMSKNLGKSPKGTAHIVLPEFGDIVRITAGETVAHVRKTDGEYPRYAAVLPKSWKGCARVDTADLLTAIADGSICCGKESRAVECTLETGTSIMVTGRTQSAGLSAAHAFAVVSGDWGGIVVNPEYAAAAVKSCGSDSIEWVLNGKMSPMEFRNPNGRMRCIVMPITLDA